MATGKQSEHESIVELLETEPVAQPAQPAAQLAGEASVMSMKIEELKREKTRLLQIIGLEQEVALLRRQLEEPQEASSQAGKGQGSKRTRGEVDDDAELPVRQRLRTETPFIVKPARYRGESSKKLKEYIRRC